MSGAVRWGEGFDDKADESATLLRSLFLTTRSMIGFVIVFSVIVALIVFRKELTSIQAMTMTIVAIAHLAWSTLKTPPPVASSAAVVAFQAAKAHEADLAQDNGFGLSLLDASVQQSVDQTFVETTSVQQRRRIWTYLIVQLTLAGIAIYSTGKTQAILLLWLLLLPSATDATLLLRRWGIFTVSMLCLVVNTIGFIRAFGWQAVHTLGIIQVGFSIAFVVAVTEIAARSVKTRREALRLEHELQLANIRLRRYAVQAEEFAAARERYRIAREIHDTIGHALTVVNVQLEVALTMLEHAPAMAHAAIDKSQSMIREGLQEIRKSVSELRSSPIDNRSLVDALRHVVTEVDTTECPVTLEVLGEVRELTDKAHLCLFRAGQECVTNSKRHSSATLISLVLDYRRENSVSLNVKDNGRGAAGLEEGFGLIGIRERSLEAGGTVSIVTSLDHGFELAIRVAG